MKMRMAIKSSVAAPLLFLAACHLDAKTTSDITCFTSGEKNPIDFEMRTYYDDDTDFAFGSIKYRQSKTLIPIILKSSIEEPQGGNHPSEFTTTWLEVVDGAVSGSYKLISQGSLIISMTYTNFKSKKEFGFIRDTGANLIQNKGCIWDN